MGLFDFFKRRKKTVQNSDVAIHKEPEVVLRAGNVTTTPFDIDSALDPFRHSLPTQQLRVFA